MIWESLLQEFGLTCPIKAASVNTAGEQENMPFLKTSAADKSYYHILLQINYDKDMFKQL